MNKIFDKIITGFFVFVLGILWYASVKYYVKPDQYSILVYDIFGKEFKIDGIRTDFKTHNVAQSFIKEYQKLFPQYEFILKTSTIRIKKRVIFNLLKNYR